MPISSAASLSMAVACTAQPNRVLRIMKNTRPITARARSAVTSWGTGTMIAPSWNVLSPSHVSERMR